MQIELIQRGRKLINANRTPSIIIQYLKHFEKTLSSASDISRFARKPERVLIHFSSCRVFSFFVLRMRSSTLCALPFRELTSLGLRIACSFCCILDSASNLSLRKARRTRHTGSPPRRDVLLTKLHRHDKFRFPSPVARQNPKPNIILTLSGLMIGVTVNICSRAQIRCGRPPRGVFSKPVRKRSGAKWHGKHRPYDGRPRSGAQKPYRARGSYSTDTM